MRFISTTYKSTEDVYKHLLEDKNISKLLEELTNKHSEFKFETLPIPEDKPFFEIVVTSPKYEVGVAIFYIEISKDNHNTLLFKPKFDMLRSYTNLPQDECKKIMDEIQTVVFSSLLAIESLF